MVLMKLTNSGMQNCLALQAAVPMEVKTPEHCNVAEQLTSCW